jgi:hypothetical protein
MMVGEARMLETYSALWRIEFRTDASKADALAIPLGYLRESSVAENGRFLGLIFRPTLTPLELDRINLNTWPEIAGDQLEAFMNALFDRSWVDVCAADEGVLGTAKIAASYAGHSALAFVSTTVKEIKAKNWMNLQLHLHESLFDFEEFLHPALSAEVLPFNRQAAPMPQIEIPGAEIMLKAA